jgi:hypothetical protein
MNPRESSTPLAGELFLSFGGIATSVATAFGLYLVAAHTRFDFSSFMVWFVIPIGAILAGAAAASGYYFISLAIDQPPTRRLAVNMTVIGLSAYLLIKYFSYLALTFDNGVPVSSVIPFWTYYQVAHDRRTGVTGLCL